MGEVGPEVRADPEWLRGLAATVRGVSTDLDEAARKVEAISADVGTRLAAWSVGAALASSSAGIWHEDAAVMSFRVAGIAGGLSQAANDYAISDHANASGLTW